MADREFKILITGEASSAVAAAEQTAQAFKGVEAAATASNTKTAESTKDVAVKQAELKKVVNELSRDFPALGLAARLAMNPLVAGLTGIISYFAKLRQEADATTSALQPTPFLTMAAAMADLAEAQRQAEVESYKYRSGVEALAQSKQTLAEKTAAYIGLLKEEEASQRKLMEAQKRVELATASSPEQVAEIHARFAGKGEELRRATAAREIRAKSDELGVLSGKIPQAEARAIQDDADLQRMKSDQIKLEKQRDMNRKNIAASEEKEKRLRDQIDSYQSITVKTIMEPKLRKAIAEEQAVQASLGKTVGMQDEAWPRNEKRIADQERRVRDNTAEVGQMQSRRNALERELPELAARESRNQRTESTVTRLNELADLKRIDVDQDRKAAELQKQIAAEHAKTGELNLMLVEELRQLKEQNRKLEQRIAGLSTNGAFN